MGRKLFASDMTFASSINPIAYEDGEVSMRRINILGTVPPPIGGVSNHIMRLIDALNKEDCQFDFCDLRKPSKIHGYINLIKKSINRKYDVIHYQLNNWFECWILYLLYRGKNRVFISTIHSFRPSLMGKISRRFANVCIKSSIRLIAPSLSIKEDLVRFGFDEGRIIVHNTYLSPTENELSQQIPEEISSFIKIAKEKNGYVILGNAYKLYLDKNHEDVYGLDISIEACRRISRLYLVFCMPLYDLNYLKDCVGKINRYHLSDRILLYTKQSSLVPIFKIVDLFVRPTITDSFGISVTEAIECGIPALASDVCERAKGTILYKNKDVNDFCNTINKIMNENIIVKPEKINYVEFYIKLYNCLEQ